MLAAPTVPKSGQGLLLQHCRVSFMTYPLHLNMMIRQMVSRGLVYPQRVSRLTYTAPKDTMLEIPLAVPYVDTYRYSTAIVCSLLNICESLSSASYTSSLYHTVCKKNILTVRPNLEVNPRLR